MIPSPDTRTGDPLVDDLAALARVPSAVPLGEETLIEPDHPTLRHYVQEHLRPAFLRLGAYDIIDLPRNQFAVRLGEGDGPCLALMAYTPTQHHNLMDDPWSGRIRTPVELGLDEPCLFGQGVTQNKTHQACLLDLARWVLTERVPLHGTLLLCVNNEGRSSHDCTHAILDGLPRTPDLVIQLFPTGFDLTVGNRGRVDVIIEIQGMTAHSSYAGRGTGHRRGRRRHPAAPRTRRGRTDTVSPGAGTRARRSVPGEV